MRLFNVRYFVVQTEATKARVASLPGVRLVSPPGEWELYAFDDPAPGHAVVPSFAPVLTFATFSVKPRPDDSLDFVRLGEEMFAAGRLDVPLVSSPCREIDTCADWNRFRTALLIDLRYRDRTHALATIERFTRDRHLVLVASDDPLVTDLVALARERQTIHIVERSAAPESSRAARLVWTRDMVKRLLDVIDAIRERVQDGPIVTSATIEGDFVRVELDRDPDRAFPLWIRQTYFPNWTTPSGEPVYMATPTFQLVFATSRDIELRFSRSRAEWAGRLASLIGLLVIAVVFRSSHN
ncbi:MAG: hypothetical protein IPM54_34630 [Polyangiaceae bacterium]|nr:hypothetical protein [Polyangiaceae bacterium]